MINYALIIFMFAWQPTQNQVVVLCVIAGLWGVSEAIGLTQLTVLYGMLFPETNEAAFANFCLWDATGFVICYILLPHVRVTVGLVILFLMLTFGMCGYMTIKYRWHRKQAIANTDTLVFVP
ncbi:unnamed protein product [Adineta ricciae]|nr:unnamed protein product [Adineta ricciae]